MSSSLFNRRRAQAFERAKVSRQNSGRALADVAYAEAVNEMRQIALLARSICAIRFVADFSAIRSSAATSSSFSGRGRRHRAPSSFPRTARPAHRPTLQSASPAAKQVQQPSFQLRRAIRRDAARDHFAFGPRDDAAAHRTVLRHLKLFFFTRAPRLDDLEDFRNNLAALFDQDPIALAHVEAFDLVRIVQRRAGDGSSRELDRFKISDGSQRARAPDLHDDV